MNACNREVKVLLHDFAVTSSNRTARKLRLFFTLASAISKMLHNGGGATIQLGAVTRRLSFSEAVKWANDVKVSIPFIWIDAEACSVYTRRPNKSIVDFCVTIDDVSDYIDCPHAREYV